MRTIDVYCGNCHAGQLIEWALGDYEFCYDVDYLDNAAMPAISVTLPKRSEPFRSHLIFPFFVNLLPEGANRKALCQIKHVDEKDFFGMLQMICGMDCIGNVTLKGSIQ